MKTGVRMRKFGAVLVALVMALSLAFAVLPQLFTPAMAGTIAGSGFEDNFDGKGIDAEKWTTSGKGVSQKVMAGTLKMKNMPAGSSVITASKVGTADQDLIVQFDMIGYTGQGNMMIVKGMDAQTPSDADMSDAYLQVGTDPRSMKGDGTTVFDNYFHFASNDWLGNNAWGSVGMPPGYRYSFNFKADGTFLLQVKLVGGGDSEYIDVIRSENTKFSKVGDGFFGFYFQGDTPSFEIDNIEIKDGDGKVTFTDDFEKDGLDTEKWVASAAVTSGPAFSIAMQATNEASYLISKEKVFDMGTQNVSAKMNFQFAIADLKNASFVTVFGLAGAAMSGKYNKVVIQDVDGNLQAALVSGGEIVGGIANIGKTAENLGDFAIAKFINVEFEIINNTADQDIVVRVNGKEVISQKYLALNGHFALGVEPSVVEKPTTAAEGEDTEKLVAADVGIDNLKVAFTDYVVSEGENLFTDFSSDDLGEDWYFTSMGVGGSEENPTPNGNGAFIRDGKLEFHNASDGTYFGPKKQYSNFDLTFDVTDIVYDTIYNDDDEPIQSASTWLGIAMGRRELDSQYHGGDGGGAHTIFIDNNPWGGGAGAIAGRAYMMRAGSGPVNEDITYNYKNAWSKESQERGALTIRLRAVNGIAEVYFRYADEPLSKLDIPVMTWTNVQTNGYLALCCTAGASFKIDNFSIVNLDQSANVPEVVTETGIEVNTSDVTKQLANGASLDLSGMKVYALNSDGTRTLLSADQFTVDQGGFDATKGGEFTITVTYGSFNGSFKVSVAAPAPVEETPKGGCGSNLVATSAAAIVSAVGLSALGCVLAFKRKKS